MGGVLGIPIVYAVKRIFANENGFLVGLKEVLALMFLEFNFRGKKKRLDLYDPWSDDVSNLEKVNYVIPEVERSLEYPRQLEHDNVDSLFFCGFNSSQEKLVVKITRNKAGMATSWIYFRLKDGRIFTLPITKESRVPLKTGSQTFAAGGLRFSCLEAMRKWRISFTGLLLEQGSAEVLKPRTMFVKFSLIWSASSFVYDLKSDISSRTLAKYLASMNPLQWIGNLSELSSNFDKYVQAGSMIGTFKIEHQDEQELYLWGTRKRSLEKFSKSNLYTEAEYFVYAQEGEMLYFSSISHPDNNTTGLEHGFIVEATSLSGAVDLCRIDEDDQTSTITFQRNKFHWTAKLLGSEKSLQLSNINGTLSSIRVTSVSLNGESGNGLIIKSTCCLPSKDIPVPKHYIPDPIVAEKPSLVMSLQDSSAQDISLSGGKGHSLANLRFLNTIDNRFTVAKGIVVSCAAFEEFLNHACLDEDISALEKSAWQKDTTNLQEACQRLSSKVRQADIPASTKRAIQNVMQEEFGADWEQICVAVRSSASGEDSDEMSAAGQMKTFLGIKSSAKIYNAVVNCWASQFEFLPIQYKRQNGQLLNSPMAVIIQEMVSADAAGVMFTCDPVTGNPLNITISSNYGIGESVVSASSEPDTIILNRHDDGNTAVQSVQVGSKKNMVLLKDGEVIEEGVSEEMTTKCCIQDKIALRLGALGIMVEEAYGCPVDIEWAVKDDHIYLLQARPITTFHRETDFEIMHESDNSTRREGDWFTTANVGEVYPGATSFLGFSSFMKYSEASLVRVIGKRGKTIIQWSPYFGRSAVLFMNHAMFNVLDILLRFYNGKPSIVVNTMNITLCGRVLDDPEMLRTATRRTEFYPNVFAPLQTVYFITDAICASRRLRKRQAAFPVGTKYEIPKNLSAEEIYYTICNQWLSLADPMLSHTDCGVFSSLANMLLMSILVNEVGGSSNDALSDVAYVLSNCSEVESAQVPIAIRDLASAITNSKGATEFRNMECKDAVLWLERTNCEAGKKFRSFLEKHGHRCIKEIDLYATPWGDDPAPLVRILQEMVTCEDRQQNFRASHNTNETIEHLKTPLNWKQRLMMKIVIPFCRKAVGLREQSKSFVICFVACMRHSYRHLATQMVIEGRLPDAELLYFTTHYELLELIKTRSPRIVQKAIRRRALFPSMDKMVFPEMNKGIPRPINFNQEVTQEGSLTISGVPVSQGIATGRVRVATSIQEAAAIQNGEILIAYSTDIGWSPYFPMLAGIATELGGLMSHGAVVAREYGLPCIVGVHGATLKFKTGNKVIIDGTKGTLTRIEE